MSRTIRAIIVCMTLATASAAHAAQVSNMAPCAPNAQRQVQTLDGFLIAHIECSNVLLELPAPMLNRPILLYTEFAALSTGAAEYAPGSAIDSRPVRWARYGSKVALLTLNYDNWAGESEALRRGIDAIALPTVIAVFDVVREGAGGAPVIDITPLFTTDPPEGFALEFKRHYRMAHVDGRRSMVQNVKAFPENIQIGFYQTWVPYEKDLLKPEEGEQPPPAALGFAFKTNFLLLPEKPMQPRCEDERVGYFSIPFNDYSSNEHRVLSKAVITRYRLEKKDPSAAVSEPVKPIMFYLSPEIPAKWRPYLRQAVEQWQAPLESAGFKNAIFARDAPTKD